jgi:hypothetical protein
MDDWFECYLATQHQTQRSHNLGRNVTVNTTTTTTTWYSSRGESVRSTSIESKRQCDQRGGRGSYKGFESGRPF